MRKVSENILPDSHSNWKNKDNFRKGTAERIKYNLASSTENSKGTLIEANTHISNKITGTVTLRSDTIHFKIKQ